MPGALITCEGAFFDLVPDQRLVMATGMSLGDQRISVSLVTIELLPHGGGTRLVCTHQGAFFQGADGPQIREQGWRVLFENLASEFSR